MNEILELESLGYQFRLEDDRVRYKSTAESPDVDKVTPLLMTIKEKRGEAVEFLKSRVSSMEISKQLFAEADKAEKAGDWNRWIALLQAASFERSISYARNEYDHRRCPKCPNLGKGPLYELGGEQILCDVECPE